MKKNIPTHALPDLIDSQYKIFFELTEQGFCLVEKIPGPDGHASDYRYLAVNPAFQKQIGIPNVIGQTMRGTTPEGKLAILEHYDRVVATGKTFSFEEYVPEMKVWIQAEVFPTKIPGQIAILFNNVTNRKRAEKSLQESEERLRTLTNMVPALLWEADVQGAEINLTERWRRYTGQTFEETQNWIWLNAIHPQDRLNTEKAFAEAFTTGKAIELEHRIRSADGEYRWFQVQHQPIFDKNGHITKWFGAAIDIHESKLAQQALHESEEKYHTLFHTMDEGFHIIELIYNNSGKPYDYLYLEGNNAFLTQTGLSNVEGKLGSIASPGTEPYWVELYDRVVKTGETTRFENYNSFTGRWYGGSASRVDKAGSHKVAVLFNDITDRKQLADRQAFLLKLSDTLRAETGIEQIGKRATELIAEKLNADRVYLVTLTPGTDEVIVTHEWRQQDMPPLLGSYRSSDFPSAIKEIFEKTIVYDDIRTDQRLTELDRISLAGLGATGFIAAPVRKGNEAMIWAAGALTKQARKWTTAEITLFEDAVERTWAALERAKAEEVIKQTTIDLQQQVNKFDITLSTIEDNVFSFDREGRVIFANKHLLNLWGLQPGEEEGKLLDELDYPQDLITILYGYIERVFTTGKTIRDEAPYTSPTGITGYYDYVMTPVFKESGEVDYIIGSAHDVSERVKAAKVLQASEERQQYLLKLSDALRPLIDPVEIQKTAVRILGEHLQVNRAFYGEVMDDGDTLIIGPGYTKDTPPIEGRIKFTDFDTDLPEYYRKGQTIVLNNVDTDVSNSKEAKNALKAINVCAAIGVPLIKEGALRAILSLHQSTERNWTETEITLIEETAERTWAAVERAKAEALLRDSEMRRKIAMDAFEIGMFVWYPLEDRTEPDGRLLQLYGLKTSDEITKSLVLAKLIYPEDREYYARMVNRAVDPRGSGNLYAEVRVVHPDGSLHWLMITGQTIFEGKPLRPARMYGLAWDITGKKEVEEALKQSEAKYLSKLEKRVVSRTAELQESRDWLQSIFDTTLIQMSILEAIRNKKGEIIDLEIKSVNKELERVTGRTDLIGKRYTQEYPGVRKVGIFDLIVKTIETGIPQQKEYFYAYEGFKQWFSCMFVKINDGVVATNTDITARKQAEETIKKMEAEQQRQIFQTSLSTLEEERHRISESLHNGLGQLLYGVKLSLANLRKETVDNEFSETKNYTEKLLTDAIRENRRISHELMPVVLEEFGLKLAVEDICNQFSDGTRFSCSVKAGKKRLEKYLELAVYRTVQELMINVVKHANATEAAVKIEVKPEVIIMSVTDNGDGIVKNAPRKSGIGLKSIRSKIKLLNGNVLIQSKKDNGTLVEVTIPLIETAD